MNWATCCLHPADDGVGRVADRRDRDAGAEVDQRVAVGVEQHPAAGRGDEDGQRGRDASGDGARCGAPSGRARRVRDLGDKVTALRQLRAASGERGHDRTITSAACLIRMADRQRRDGRRARGRNVRRRVRARRAGRRRRAPGCGPCSPPRRRWPGRSSGPGWRRAGAGAAVTAAAARTSATSTSPSSAGPSALTGNPVPGLARALTRLVADPAAQGGRAHRARPARTSWTRRRCCSPATRSTRRRRPDRRRGRAPRGWPTRTAGR